MNDTKNFLLQRHEEHFEALVHNNALVFEALDSWLATQATPKQLDWALPLPVLGELCGPGACY